MMIRFSAEPQPKLQQSPPVGGKPVALMEPPERPNRQPQAPEPKAGWFPWRALLILAVGFGACSVDKTRSNEQATVRYPFSEKPTVVQPDTFFFNPPFVAKTEKSRLPQE